MKNRRVFLSYGSMFGHLIFCASLFGQDTPPREPPARPAADARNHIGEEATYSMIAQSTKRSEGSQLIFLDSEKDYRDPNNLAVVIPFDALGTFEKAGILKPEEHFKGKSLRVKGKVVKQGMQTRIVVKELTQIQVIEDKK